MAETLWCVHIVGPDDVIAYPDKESAEHKAGLLNAVLEKQNAAHVGDENWPVCRAEVMPWPHSPESHAADLAWKR